MFPRRNSWERICTFSPAGASTNSREMLMKGVGEVTFGNKAPGPALPARAKRRKERRVFTGHLLIYPTKEVPTQSREDLLLTGPGAVPTAHPQQHKD